MSIRFHRQKQPGKDYAGVSRRMFLMTTAMAGVGGSALIGTSSSAVAAIISYDEDATLLRMVQDIYPHPDRLKVAHYRTIADAVKAGAEEDPTAAGALRDGLRRVDERARELFDAAYVDVTDPDAREGILRGFQDEGFFQSARWAAYFGIYNNPEVWPLFGYEGSSVEYGGYLDRGFSDIGFVPQGPSLEERLARVQR